MSIIQNFFFIILSFLNCFEEIHYIVFILFSNGTKIIPWQRKIDLLCSVSVVRNALFGPRNVSLTWSERKHPEPHSNNMPYQIFTNVYIKTRRGRPIDDRRFPCVCTFSWCTTPKLWSSLYFVICNRKSFITRQYPSTCNPPLYIAVSFEPLKSR